MDCPQCEGPTEVFDSRPKKERTEIRRRRRCLHCGFRFTTIEKRPW